MMGSFDFESLPQVHCWEFHYARCHQIADENWRILHSHMRALIAFPWDIGKIGNHWAIGRKVQFKVCVPFRSRY